MDTIPFSGILTFENYQQADRINFQSLPPQARYFIPLMGIILFSGFIMAMLLGIRDWSRLVTLIIVPGVPLLLGLRRNQLLRNTWQRIPLLQSKYQGKLSEQGIDFTLENLSIAVEWQLIGFYQMTDEIVVLYLTYYNNIILPRHFFGLNPDDWQHSREIITAQVPSERPPHWRIPYHQTQPLFALVLILGVVLFTLFLP